MMFNALPCLLLLLSFTATADTSAADEKFNFDLLIERLNERYKDFFIREQEKKRRLEVRRQGVGEQTTLREEVRKRREKARKAFIRNRKAKLDLEIYLPEHEAELEKRRRKREASRRSFLRQRRQLHDIKSRTKNIPEEKEVGLE